MSYESSLSNQFFGPTSKPPPTWADFLQPRQDPRDVAIERLTAEVRRLRHAVVELAARDGYVRLRSGLFVMPADYAVHLDRG